MKAWSVSPTPVFSIEPPSQDESFDIAQSIVAEVLHRFGLADKVSFERRAVCRLAHLSLRLMVRAVEQAAAATVATVVDGRCKVREEGLWAGLGRLVHAPRLP
jgi:hypothetical protein